MTTYLFTNIEMKIYFLADINEGLKTEYMQQETVPNVHTVYSEIQRKAVAIFVEAQFYIAFHAITGACHAAWFTSTLALAQF